MQIELIRHGSTAGNLEHRYVGSTDEELTADTIHVLKQKAGAVKLPDLVFVSPMKRCVQTAEFLFPGIPKELTAGLKECDFGEFEYRNYQELQGDERYQSWIDIGGTSAFPGGESREQFSERCSDAFEKACREALAKKYERIAFVVHGGTIMAVLDRFSQPHRDYFDWQVKNLEGFEGILTIENGEIRITEIGERR